MKRIIAGVILLLAPLSLHAAEVKFPPLNGPVVDAANQIPDDQEAVLSKELKQFQKDSGHQFVVVTVPDLQDKEAGDYALEFGRHHGVGRKDINDGIILLQYPGNGTKGSAKISIKVGRGMEYILTDAQMSSIIRNTMGSIVKQDRPRSETMPKAIVAGAREIMRLGRITPEQKAEFDRKEKEASEKRSREAWDSFVNFLAILILTPTILFGIYWLATAKKRRLAKEREEADRIKFAKLQKEARQRQDEEMRERARLDREKAKQREDMLNAMSPQARQTFLNQEEQVRRVEAERQRQARERARSAAALREAEENRRQSIREQQRREEQSSWDYVPPIVVLGGGNSSSGGSNFTDDSDNDRYSGGGGDFGGGGADGDL